MSYPNEMIEAARYAISFAANGRARRSCPYFLIFIEIDILHRTSSVCC